MTVDRSFARRAGVQAYLIAAFSLAYAIVYLAFVRRDPNDHSSAAVAWALLAAGSLAATIATVAAAARIGGDARWWLSALGVGYGLLSAVHGIYAAIAEVQALPLADPSPTDPRGLATFGLAGLWALTLGLEIRAGNGSLPGGLGWLAIVAGVDLILLFIATVGAGSGTTVSAPWQNVVLLSGGLASVVLVPALWIWTGRALRA
jgi:hypothetical protein